jgi:N-acetylmuramoyl-L-alanine amidase
MTLWRYLVPLSLASCFYYALAHAQAPVMSRPPILLVVPEKDTTTTSAAAYRLSGCTSPSNRVKLNGNLLKVYPSGAFVGLLPLTVGENPWLIEALSGDSIVAVKQFLVVRSAPLTTSSFDSAVIDDAMMGPATSMWVGTGDIIRLQCKGTPHSTVTVWDSITLNEVPASEAGGLGGVFRGFYVISSNDRWTDRAITYRLKDSLGRVATKEGRARVSCRTAEFPLVGVLKGERPYLNFGLGEDRLGGAKMSFVVPGVRVAINGKVGDQYRIALAQDQEAWVPEAMVDLYPPGRQPPTSLTGSWTVSGDQKYDYVTINLDDRLPYSSFTEAQPSRICIDVYGAVSNSNWITQHLTTREIRNVSYQQMAKDVFRIAIELGHKQVWGYDISYRGTTLVVKVRRQPERLKIKALRFALDAGHGGWNEGAIGSTGTKEKDINLATVLHLKRLLEDKGATVVLTRSDDRYIPNNERVKTVLGSDADMLISVHSNSVGNTSNPELVKGTSTYYRHVCFRPLSQRIYAEVLKSGLAPFGNVGGFNFLLNSPTEIPNVLVELAFMSHPEDEMLLLDDEYREELAERIVDGIEEFLDDCDE